MTLRWRAALLFGGQLILVSGGVIAMLLLQQVQHSAVTSADAARRAQVVEAEYFAGMVEAESGLQEYLDTGDATNLTAYSDGLSEVAAADAALRLVKADSTERSRRDAMLAESAAWQLYAAQALAPTGTAGPTPAAGDEIFAAYSDSHRASTSYLESVVAQAAAAEVQTSASQILALAAIGAVAMITVVAGAILIHRSTLVPMGRLVQAARELAAGARTELPPPTSAGEIGDLSRALHAWQSLSEKRIAVAEGMHEVSGRIDRDEIVKLGLERLLEISEGAEVAVLLVDEAGTMITTMTADKRLSGPRRLTDQSALASLLGSAVSLNGEFDDEGWPEGLRDWGTKAGYGPVTVVHMVSGSKVLGLVAAARSLGRPSFDDVDVALVEAMASPLAAAIRIAGLFEEVRAVSAQLDIVSRHKTDFLSSMSHELRTPLNSILGFADLLITPGFDALTAKQARYIANIRASGAHLASLIDDALDLAKVESGKAELELEQFDVGRLVAEVVATMQPMAIAAQVKLVSGRTRSGEIAADRRKLHQVLLNLLSNAIKFTPPAGNVTITARRTAVQLLLTVVDTGIGVAIEDQERIFGAFEQVAGANRDGGGTGLGLALSRQYVELHGGRLWMESGIGEGSSFHLSLPLAVSTALAS